MKRFIQYRLLRKTSLYTIRLIRHFFHRRLPFSFYSTLKRLNLGIIRIQSLYFAIRRLTLYNGIRQIRVLPILYSFGNSNSVVFCEFDLGCNVGIDVAPYLTEFKECSCCEERIGGLSRKRRRIINICLLEEHAGRLLGSLVSADRIISSGKDFEPKLLNVSLTSNIVRYSIVIGILIFEL